MEALVWKAIPDVKITTVAHQEGTVSVLQVINISKSKVMLAARVVLAAAYEPAAFQSALALPPLKM